MCSSSTAAGSGLVDFGLVGKLTDEDMACLTRLFIDAATENVDVPRRLAELGVRYPKEREDEFATELRELFTATTAPAWPTSTRSR